MPRAAEFVGAARRTARITCRYAFASLDRDMVVAEFLVPPTMRERAVFDAATNATPKEFVQACRAADLEPRHMLDAFDAAPWRWLFSFSPDETITDEVRHRIFQPSVRRRLEVAREYIDASWWRRLFSSPEATAPSQDSVGRGR
jgi:hypothetical protein